VKVNEFDIVELVDGRSGTILDIYDDPTSAYGVDIDYGEEGPPEGDDGYEILESHEIKQVLWRFKVKTKYSLQRNDDGVLILCDGKSIGEIGYKRNTSLENKGSIRNIIGNKKALLLVNYERNSLEQIEIDFPNEWENKYEKREKYNWQSSGEHKRILLLLLSR
jgi:hypothetical protein